MFAVTRLPVLFIGLAQLLVVYRRPQ
jgi:hypothetical protein